MDGGRYVRLVGLKKITNVQYLNLDTLLKENTYEGNQVNGGKRPGAGRSKADTVNVQLKLNTRTAARLRALVPVGQRSAFVTDAIDEALCRKWNSEPE
jgi:hypothetical protein